MAKDTNIGIKISTDVADLKTGIKQIKDEISRADKDFQKATAGLDRWSTSSEGLEAKLTQLNTKLNSQKKSVELYQAEIERVSKLEGDHSAELEKLKDKLESAEIAVKKTEKEINHYSNSLEDVTKKEKEAETELGKLTKKISEQESELKDLQNEYKDAVITYGRNSKEAKNLSRQIGDLSDELDDNRNTIKKADDELEKLDKQFDETADSAEDFSKGIDGLKNLGGTVAKGIGAIGAGVGALASAFLGSASATKEFRTNMGKLETSFTEAGLTAEDAKETYKSLYSVLGDEGQATEATTFLAKIADNEKELTDMTHTLTGIYATFGASLPLEGLTEAINHTSSLGSVQGNLADALEWSGVNVDDFNAQLEKCSDEEERQALIMETLSGIYDGAADTYKEVNADVIASNEAQANLSETMAKLGEKAEPILTIVKDGFNSIMQEVLALMENVDFEALAEKIKSGFAYFIDTIIPAIINGFQWVMDNKDILITGIVAIGTAMLAWNVVTMIQGVVKAIKGWTVATEGLTLAQKLMNLVMKANPIGIVISLITGLVAGFITLWNTSDEFRAFWINLWEKIKVACSKAWDGIKKVWEVVAPWFKKIFTQAWENIKQAWSFVTDFFKDVKEKGILGAFKGLAEKMLDIGKNLVKGLWNGIKDMTSWITDKLKGFGDSVLGGIKKFFGINSPSKETAKLGVFIAEGLGVGIKKGEKDVIHAGEEVGEHLLNAMENSVDGVALEPDINVSGGFWNNFISETAQALNIAKDELETFADEMKTKISAIGDGFKELGKTIFDAFNQSIDNQIKQLDFELEKQRELKKQGIITEEELAKAEEETIKKKNALAKKQFNAQKANDLAQATIQGALAIMKGFAELGPIAGAVNAVIQGTITAAQIGTIASQKFVPMLAKGGIVNGPTLAMVGEAGKEAVMPLENNTGWIRELAEKLNEIMKKDFSFNAGQLQLNPAMAQSPVVNNYYYQTIQSPQQLNRREIYRDTKNLLSLKGM